LRMQPQDSHGSKQVDRDDADMRGVRAALPWHHIVLQETLGRAQVGGCVYLLMCGCSLQR
jgi:hypothetical protein